LEAPSDVDVDGVREGVMRWVRTCGANEGVAGLYRLTPEHEPAIMPTCFAVFAMELFGLLPDLPEREREAWANEIKAYQQPDTGLFRDTVDVEDVLSPTAKFNTDYVVWQITYFAVNAIDALGTVPVYPLGFAAEFLGSGRVTGWFDSLDWGDPWLESNRAMWLMFFLTYAMERDWRADSVQVALIEALDWLEDNQDPATGYWGTDRGASLFKGMAGAYHLYPFPLYFGRPVRHVERIIDSTLSLQAWDGLFVADGGGGACEDLDAVDILAKMSLVTDYRRADIMRALQRALSAVIDLQRSDGGFPYHGRQDPTATDVLHLAFSRTRPAGGRLKALKRYVRPRRRQRTWSYSGLRHMTARIGESDMWSAWFRPLAICLCREGLGVPEPRQHCRTYRRLPGLGWHTDELAATGALERGPRRRPHRRGGDSR